MLRRMTACSAVSRATLASSPLSASSSPFLPISAASISPASQFLRSPSSRSFVTANSPIQKPPSTKTVRIYEKEDPTSIATKETLSYDVRRTSLANWLPIYREYKNQGTNVSTIIRRIHGDIDRLAKDLEVVAPPECIKIKRNINHITLRGDYLHDLREFFTIRKF
ncbi:mitochondrial large subunit ribosomal protein-domain-containing protein [Chytridium lagenaria]|nr:mitochondrial large subunit ribosomal protein-domain-containing protein [Chytridium lagenaria]